MGVNHFEQMYEAALAVDSLAIPLAMMLNDPYYECHMTGAQKLPPLEPLWTHASVDRLIHSARGIQELNELFMGEMQELTAEGAIRPRVTHPLFGVKVSLNDPAVFAPEVAVMTKDEFNELLMHVGPAV